jgi:tetratricopeptide (TPR) repeat protein
LPGEDRRARLLAALAAYDEALQFRRPDTAPLDYAATQNNRATLLSEMAGLPGEDRRARLLAALAAYDEALQFRRPDTAPLDYAMTQGNLLNLYSSMAELPGEDRRNWLLKALRAGWEAYMGFERSQHAQYQERATRQLRRLQTACGGDFAEMWAAVGLGVPPDWLMQDSGAGSMEALLAAFAAVGSDEEMVDFWRSVPAELEESLMQAVEALIVQAQQANESDTAEALQSRLDAFRQIRALAQNPAAASAVQAVAPLQQALDSYVMQKEAAEKAGTDTTLWQIAADAGEAALSALAALPDAPGTSDLLAGLKQDLANTYTALCIALEKQGKLDESLEATQHAIALQPDEAMWQRNRASTLIDLGRLEEAREALARARELEPAAPRLADLEAQLAQAEKTG